MNNRLLLFILLPALPLLILSCAKIDGTIAATGNALGVWTLAPDQCMTGDRGKTVGAFLYSEDNPNLGVQVTKIPKGKMQVAVTIPSTCDRHGSCKTILIEPRNCKKLSGDVKFTIATTADEFPLAEGSLELDCALFMGGKRSDLKGKVKFKNCD